MLNFTAICEGQEVTDYKQDKGLHKTYRECKEKLDWKKKYVKIQRIFTGTCNLGLWLLKEEIYENTHGAKQFKPWGDKADGH